MDHDGYENIMVEAKRTEEYTKQNEWNEATNQYRNTQRVILIKSKGVDFYNIEKPTTSNDGTNILFGIFHIFFNIIFRRNKASD